MQSGSVVIDLHLVEHVDMRFAGEFGRGDLVKRFADVFAGIGAEEAHTAVNAAILQQLSQGFIVTLLAIVGLVVKEFQSGAADNFHGGLNQWRNHLFVGGLAAYSFRGNVVNVRNAVIRNGHFVGGEA